MIERFKNKIITCIDIGSSKIVCLIAEIHENNNIKVIGIGHNISQGFKGTVITDIKLAEASIISAIYEAETMAKTNINDVLISINGTSISSENLETEININDHVTDKELKELLNKAVNSFPDQNKDIIHFFPLDFGLDENFGIKDPIGMYGYKLKVRSKIFYLPSTHVINLVNCLEKCRLNISGIIISSYGSGLACLSKEEKQQGVTLIDIGANTTSIIVFYENMIIELVNLSIGGNHITSDLSYGTAVNFAMAERIKILNGNAFLTSFDEGKMIDLSSDIEENISYTSNADISLIIRARLEEIFEIIKEKINHLDMKGLSSKKILLTGGTSKLIGIREVASSILGKTVKLASPTILEGMDPLNHKTEFASAIGGLIFMTQNKLKKNKIYKKLFSFSYDSHLSKFIRWLKENF